MPARSGSTASRSPAGRRTGSRGSASASCSSIRGRCIGRRCSRTSCSRLLPDRLLRLFADAATSTRGRAPSPSGSGLTAVLDRRPATLPFADLRKIELAKAIARDPQVVLVDEPFAGLTRRRDRVPSPTSSRGFRDEGRAVLLVDHNVKSVAALVDRVLAMYLGERIAEGTADEVMRERDRAPGLSRRRDRDRGAAGNRVRRRGDAVPRRSRTVSVLYGKAQALERVSIHVHEGEFVSVVGLNGAGKTTLFNAISGLVPYARRDPLGRAPRSSGRARRSDRARRYRALPGDARAVRRYDGARESRPRRPASRGRGGGERATGCSTCSRS